MGSRLYIVITIIVITIVGMLTGEPLYESTLVDEWGLVYDETNVNIVAIVYAVLSVVSIILLLLVARLVFTDREDESFKYAIVGSLILFISGVFPLIFGVSNITSGSYLTTIAGSASIVTSLSIRYKDIKFILGVVITFVLVTVILYLPVIYVLRDNDYYYMLDNILIGKSTFNLLGNLTDLDPLLILFSILTFMGLLVLSMSLVRYIIDKDELIEDSLVLSGSFILAASLIIIVYYNFNLKELYSGIYMILLCGISSLVFGILSKKGRL